MLGKVSEGGELAGKRVLTFNLEFVELLMYDFGVKGENIVFITDCQEKANVLKDPRYAGVKPLVIDFETLFNYPIGDNMKFDVIVGNPPYQAPPVPGKSKKTGSRGRLWDKFVKHSFTLLKDGGHMALIHPGSWRKPEHELWPILSSKQIEYLEMHPQHSNCGSAATGLKTFGVNTSYDICILHNVPCYKPTVIVDFNEARSSIDLRNWPWLPGGEYELIKSMLVTSGAAGWEITCDCKYHTQYKELMSPTSDHKHKYPVVNSITSDGPTFYWSEKNKGNFGLIKVILSKNGHPNALADLNGEYATTQNSFFITVKSKEQAKNLVKLLGTDEFKRVIWATKWSNFDVEELMFKSFKKSLYE